MRSTTKLNAGILFLTVTGGMTWSACGGDDDPIVAECRLSSECAAGYRCIDLQCVPPMQEMDAGTFVRDAGKPDTGRPDAGRPDAGRPDAEPPDADVDAAVEAEAGIRDGGPDAAICGPAICGFSGAVCGEVTDHCGGSVDCGDCAAGYDCVEHACVQCARQSCATDQCGEIDDGCGGTRDCGGCSGGRSCRNNWCVRPCQPRSCPSNTCGRIDVGCGMTRDCGGCGNGQTCQNNRCVNTCDCDPIEQCTNNRCECRPLHQGIRIGDREHSSSSADSDEFTNYTNPHPTYRVGRPTSELRPWLGHSNCATCSPGTAKKQRLVFSGLVPGVRYILAVYPSWVTGTAYYSALVGVGSATIESGAREYFTGLSEYVGPSARWTIQFVAHTTEVGFDLGHGLKSGDHYIYIDYYDFAPQHPCN